MAVFRFGLAARLRRYWPAGLVIGVAAGFVALTMLASSVGRQSLLGPVNERPPDLLVEPLGLPYPPGPPLTPDQIETWSSWPEVAWVDSSPAGRAEFRLDNRRPEARFDWRLATALTPEERRTWQLAAGRLPAAADEIAVDSFQLRVQELELGDRLSVADRAGGWRQLEIVGQLDSRVRVGFGGPTRNLNLALVEPATARQLLGLEPGQTFTVAIKLSPGADRQAVQQRLEAGLAGNYQLALLDVTDLGIVTGLTALVGFFVGLAILVGVFVIINLFQIILASQARELATLRLLGATRIQIFSRLLAESALLAVVVGLVSASLAWAAVALARPLVNRHRDWQLLEPDLSLWHWLVPALVALAATLAGAVLPAWAASRRRPVTALGRVVETPTAKLTRWRIILGAILVGLALAGLLLPVRLDWLSGNLAGGLMFAGGLGLLLGLALVSAGLARPFGRLVGRLGRPLGGVVWRLGAGNIGRQPARSAAVANSLLIGVSLITAVTILASSFQAASQRLLDHYFPSDWLIAEKFDDDLLAQLAGPVDYEQEQISPDLADQLLASGLLEAPSLVRFGQDVGQVLRPGLDDSWPVDIGGFDPETIDRNFNYNFEPAPAGPALAAGQILIDQQLAGWGLQVGQTLTVDYPASGRQADYVIAGSFTNGDYDLIMSNRDYLAAIDRPGVTFIAGDSAPGLTPDQAREGLERLLADNPTLAVYDLRTDFGELMERIINIVLNILRGLLGLSLAVAVLGILSTLSLSIRQRRRELGTLRAVGLTRLQMVGLVVFEGLAMAGFGASLGLLAGWLGGWAIIESLRTDPSLADFLGLSLPFEVLAVYGLAAALLGGLAALIPALLAARRPVIDCLADD